MQKMVYKGKVPKSSKATPFKDRKPPIFITETAKRRRCLHTSSTTAPRTRSYRPYYLRSSSSSSSRQLHMDEPIENIRDRLLWDEGMEDKLVDLLYEDTISHRLRGGRITHSDNVRLAEKLSTYGPKNFNSEQVKGKIARLKRKQREFTDLMKQTGLGWDPDRKAPVASEEHWANAIRVKNSFKHYKTNGCPKYELCAIFGCAVATGTFHRASTDPAPTSEEEDLLEEELQNRGRPVPDDQGGPSQPAPMEGSTQARIPFSASYSSGSRRPLRGGSSQSLAMDEAFSRTLEAMEKSSEARRLAAEEWRASKRNKSNSMETDAAVDGQARCFRLLDDVEPRLPFDQWNKAFKLLSENPGLQLSFMAISAERRSEWAWSL